MKIYTAVEGNNADLFQYVCHLYIKPGNTVIDVTYGKGVFWGRVDTLQFQFYSTDLLTTPKKMDFTNLEYENESIDVHVFDPPYMHTPGKPMLDEQYKNSATCKKMYHTDIMNDYYYKGMQEGFRVLKYGGFSFIKCQDEIESGYQRWSHIEIYDIAKSIGFYGKDLFILVRKDNPPIQHTQKHARKKHSYLWVFQKIKPEEHRRLIKKGIIIK